MASAPHEVEGDKPLRLVSLSDGIFATALTLLALNLKLPDLAQSAQISAAHLMSELWPHIFSYFLTFLVAGTYWLAHHRVFNQIVRYDRNLLWYNLMFLLFVGLLPFSTDAYSSDQSSPFVYSLYASDVFFIGVMLSLTWAYAWAHHMIEENFPSHSRRFELYRSFITPGISLLSIGIAFLVPENGLAQLSYLLIPVISRILTLVMFRNEKKPAGTFSSVSAFFWRLGSSIPMILLVVWAIWFFAHR